MNRLLVLMLCLASAGGIAAYTHYSRDSAEPGSRGTTEASSDNRVEGTPVYTVPRRAAEPATTGPAATVAARTIDPGDRVGLARALQRELKRVGCYDGEITGVWTTSSRMAMKAFTERVNAALPIDKPDHVLLSLVQGHQDRACGAACPAGQTAAKEGTCVPDAVLAKSAEPSGAADGGSDGPSGKDNATASAAGAAAALALSRPDGKAANGAIKPAPGKAAAPKAAGDRGATHGGPVPPEGMRERRRRRARNTDAPRPPKVVRDFLEVLGFN